jgi:hypothetical protein
VSLVFTIATFLLAVWIVYALGLRVKGISFTDALRHPRTPTRRLRKREQQRRRDAVR